MILQELINILIETYYFTKTLKNINKNISFYKTHTNINNNIKIVNLEILKVKTWFGDKDLFS